MTHGICMAYRHCSTQSWMDVQVWWRMAGWVDGWLGGWVDGPGLDGWMDGWVDGGMEGWRDGYRCGLKWSRRWLTLRMSMSDYWWNVDARNIYFLVPNMWRYVCACVVCVWLCRKANNTIIRGSPRTRMVVCCCSWSHIIHCHKPQSGPRSRKGTNKGVSTSTSTGQAWNQQHKAGNQAVCMWSTSTTYCSYKNKNNQPARLHWLL